MRPVVWHPDAVVALKKAVDFGALHWPSEALELAANVIAAIEQLQRFPESGRDGRVVGTRELLLSTYPLMVVYVALPGTIEILDIVHQPRQWPVE